MSPRHFAALVLAAVIAGCNADVRPPPVIDHSRGVDVGDAWHDGTVYQFDYPDAGVSCWVLLGSDRGGISCLPTAVPHG